MRKIYLIFFSLLCLATTVKAQYGDSLRISLITCGAGDEIYSLFGHTAIRCQDNRGMDIVFNYGVFDFHGKNFFLRFALGKTDYQLAAVDYSYFMEEYTETHRDVWEQELNLTQVQQRKLLDMLLENYRPENRIYRYNFFYDNCSTRPRDIIAKSILPDSIHYKIDIHQEMPHTTYRTLINRYGKDAPWCRFGMNFCIGSKGDRPITYKDAMFVPFYLRDFFATAQIVSPTHSKVPLVKSEKQLLSFTPEKENFFFTPVQVALLLLIITICCTIYSLKHDKSLWGYDLFLLLAAGIMGIVPAFLVLFSTHPAVSPNYLLLVFNPLLLLAAPFIIHKMRQGRKSWLFTLYGIFVLVFFILFFIPQSQKFPPSVLPLALCLLIRITNHRILTIKNK